MSVEEAARTLEIAPQTYYRWRKEYGDMNTTQARKLIDLGDTYVSRDKPGDLEKVQETYQQSLDMFTEMGAPGYIKVLEERLGNL
jgi:transposase-like protein